MDEREREHREGPPRHPRPGQPNGGPALKRVFAGLALGISGILLIGAITLVTFAQIFPAVLVFGMSMGLGLFSIAGLYREPEERVARAEPVVGPFVGPRDTEDQSPTSLAVWGASIFLAVVFAGAAILQLTNAQFVIERYREWDYPLALRWTVGTLALFGSIALLIPRLAKIGAIVLVPVAFGAVYTFLVRGHAPMALFPLVTLLLLLFVIWERSETPRHWLEDHRHPS